MLRLLVAANQLHVRNITAHATQRTSTAYLQYVDVKVVRTLRLIRVAAAAFNNPK